MGLLRNLVLMLLCVVSEVLLWQPEVFASPRCIKILDATSAPKKILHLSTAKWIEFDSNSTNSVFQIMLVLKQKHPRTRIDVRFMDTEQSNQTESASGVVEIISFEDEVFWLSGRAFSISMKNVRGVRLADPSRVAVGPVRIFPPERNHR